MDLVKDPVARRGALTSSTTPYDFETARWHVGKKSLGRTHSKSHRRTDAVENNLGLGNQRTCILNIHQLGLSPLFPDFLQRIRKRHETPHLVFRRCVLCDRMLGPEVRSQFGEGSRSRLF